MHTMMAVMLEGSTVTAGLSGLGETIAWAFTQLGTMITTIKDEPILLTVVVGLPVTGWVMTRGKSLFHH